MSKLEDLSLEALLNKATSPLDNDSDDYIDAFCEKVRTEPEGAVLSTRLLAHKIQSPQESEANKGLNCLIACVKYCGEVFEKELGKYRFLNELIKVVSPKYLGKQSPECIRKKIISMLYTWSCHFREQNKIRDAYQMLKKQGVVHNDPHFDHSFIMHVPPPRDEKNSIFNDNEKRRELDKLLKSQKPEDLQAANRLIKSVVQAEEAKMEKMKRRNEILEETSNNVRLLGDMLDCYNSATSTSTDADMQTMQDLYNSCQKLRPTLFRLASDTDDSEKALMDILRANDDVSRVMQLFEKLIDPQQTPTTTTNQTAGNSQNEIDISNDLEFLSLTPPLTSQDGLLLLDNNQQATTSSVGNHHFNLFAADNHNNHHHGGQQQTSSSATTEEQDDIGLFSFPTSSSVPQQQNIMSFHDVITPTTPPSRRDVMNPLTSSQASTTVNKTAANPLSDIDQLSSGLIEMSLGRKPEGKFPAVTTKPTLKELQQNLHRDNQLNNVLKEQQQQKTTTQILQGELQAEQVISLPMNPASGLSLLLDQESTVTPISAADDWMLSVDKQSTSTYQQSTTTSNVPPSPLTDVYVNLETIRPSSFPPVTIFDNDDVRCMLHFAKDHATPLRTDTLVAVVSIMSSKSAPLNDIAFQVAAPKVMRVKLQTPSATTLEAYNPISSNPPITQVMVIANTSDKEVKLRFKLEYQWEREGIRTHSGTITGFPKAESWGKL